MSAIGQGIMLLVVGMGVLFAAMALLILAIVLLDRLFPGRRPAPENQELQDAEVVNALVVDTEGEAVVAAIALALAHWRASAMRPKDRLGARLEAGRGRWWSGGRVQGTGRREK